MTDEHAARGDGRLESLARARQALEAPDDPARALRDSLRVVAESLGVERAFIARVGPERALTDVLASHGVSPRELSTLYAGHSSPGLSRLVVARVLESASKVEVDDSRACADDLRRDPAFLGGAWSVVCIPICAPTVGVVLGLLYLQSRAGDRAPLGVEVVRQVEAYARAVHSLWHALPHARRAFLAIEERLVAERRGGGAGDDILGSSEATQNMRAFLERVVVAAMAAPRPDPVLILGPTGSGKEVVARYLHRRSARARGRFVGLNCATFKGEILEAKLFGHVKGAFTGAGADSQGLFAAADRGVLFLDEVGDMPADGQVMLLRALETRSVRPLGGRDEREVDVQVVCATNVDLEDAVRRGRFRADLYHRINGLVVRLTGLAQRREDIAPLLAHYLAHHEGRLGKRTGGVAPEALEVLMRYDWPGNVRELQRACSVMVLHALDGERIDLELLWRALPQVCAATTGAPPAPDSIFEQDFESYREAIRTFERMFLEIALRKHNWNRAAMGRRLRLSRASVYRYLERVGLETPPDGGDWNDLDEEHSE